MILVNNMNDSIIHEQTKFIQSEREVPEDLGYFSKDFFDSNKDYFDLISNEHTFQTLTESNKESNAFRKGIYLTHVNKDEDNDNTINFKLLRCSSNFNGPTDNFRSTDLEILDKVNKLEKELYNYNELNHVLAQIYYNHKSQGKDKKAKIKQHSDKTKDMSEFGTMAFCTFYKDIHSFDTNDDRIFTKLRFRLKKDNDLHEKYPEKFDIILYHNSLLLIPLKTNRFYTHEIIPSCLPIEQIPTRLGYVIRCSNRKAIFKDNQTFIINNNNELTKLEDPTPEGVQRLKELYKLENITSQNVKYDDFNFSLNKGDYIKPIL